MILEKFMLHKRAFIVIVLLLVFFWIGLEIGEHRNREEIRHWRRVNRKLSEFSTKKTAMMLSYAEGLNDGLHTPIFLLEDTFHSKWYPLTSTNRTTLLDIQKFQAMYFLSKHNILNIQTSNYMIMIMILERRPYVKNKME